MPSLSACILGVAFKSVDLKEDQLVEADRGHDMRRAQCPALQYTGPRVTS